MISAEPLVLPILPFRLHGPIQLGTLLCLCKIYNLYLNPPYFPEAFYWYRLHSMSKARKMGWHGFVDSTDSIQVVLGELAHIGMTPPVSDIPQANPKTA